MVSTGVPAVSVEIDRISVFLGANGSGKSRLLKHLLEGNHSGAFNGLMPVYVEGGRVFKDLQAHVTMGPHNASVFSFPDQGLVNHVGGSGNPISGRVNMLFSLLEALGENIEKTHSRDVVSWQNSGEIGPCPKIKQLPLNKLFEMFHAIFPNLRLSKFSTIMVDNLVCGGQTYTVQELSDGERQVLCLLADLLCIDRPRSFFIVDEPELFLHPALAERLWSLVEDTFADSYFVYATHSFAFAARPEVKSRYVLGYGEVSDDELWSSSSEDFLRPFWGAVPLLLKSKMTLLVEGTPSSFDLKFYQWILEDKGIDIVPVGSCDNVLKACNGASLWGKLSHTCKLAGVVDSDFTTTPVASQNVYRLEFHEAESYLCHPDLVAFVTECLGQNEVVQPTDILKAIIENAKGSLISIVSKRIDRQFEQSLRPSVSRGSLQTITDIGGLVKTFESQRSACLAEAAQKWTAGKSAILIRKEHNTLLRAIKDEDVEVLLRLFEGKSLLKTLLSFPGSADDIAFLSATKKHIEIKNYPHLQKLQDSLVALFV